MLNLQRALNLFFYTLLIVLIDTFITLYIHIILGFTINDILIFQLNLIKEYFPVLISLTAILLTLDEAIQTRKHNKLSVKPLLTFDTSVGDGYYLRVLNNGIGPAIIKETQWFYKNELINKSEIEAIDTIVDYIDFPNVGITRASLFKDEVIGAGSTHVFISFNKKNITGKQKLLTIKSLINIGVLIKYESIYGEPFVREFKYQDHIREDFVINMI